MPLQNRVTPYGEIVALAGRGLFMGNRGILHDDERHIVRFSATKRWIACVLEFKGIRRRVMTPHRYTELFFLDEAVALSAGHRPCAECRRADFNHFRALWRRIYGEPSGADDMDRVLHEHRLDGKRKRTYRAALSELPDGAYVAVDDRAWLLHDGMLCAWSDSGYGERRAATAGAVLDVLTPRPIVEILAAGYLPQLFPTR